jgi:zinc transporter
MSSISPICAFYVDKDGKAQAIVDEWPDLSKNEKNGYYWLHFDMAQKSLSKRLSEKLPIFVVGNLLQKETRPRFSAYDEGFTLNLRGVNLNPNSNMEDMVSLRLWVAKNIIVTTRRRKGWSLDAIRKGMEHGEGPKSIGAFLSVLTQDLTDRIESISLELEEMTDAFEEVMIESPEGLGLKIAPLRQNVIKMRRYVGPQREALARLAEHKDNIIDEISRKKLKNIVNQSIRTVEELDATRERLSAIHDYLDAHHAKVIGRNSYILSVVAAIFLPLMFLTGLFGMNVGGMPGLESAYGFAIVTAVSVMIGLILAAIFWFLKWL